MTANQSSPIRVGTAAWSDHQDFYPPGLKANERITYYARYFPVVEVNASYYHILPERNYAMWVDKTPDDFRFNVKAYGQLTGHHRDEEPTPEAFEQFRRSYTPLRESGKLGAVLFQFPPWFDAKPENKQQIAQCAELMADDPLLVEFRHVSWLEPEQRDDTLDFLRELRLSHVTVDAPQVGRGTARLVPAVTNPSLAYLRMHGRNTETWYKRVKTTAERFNYLYSDEELLELSDTVRELEEKAEEVHVIFNNNMQNYAVLNAQTMMGMLGMESPIVETDEPQQQRMNF